MEVINQKQLKAIKNHICGFCGCEISKGSNYITQFNKDGNDVWTFKCHIECLSLVGSEIIGDETDGVNEDMFIERLNSYISMNHYDDEKNDIDDEWKNINDYDKVKKILKEIKK